MDQNPSQTHGQTPLHIAALEGDAARVAVLLREGADVNAVDDFGWTPVFSAARGGQAEVVTLLLRYGANINATNRMMNKSGGDAFFKGFLSYPIHHASTVEVLEILIAHGASVHARDGNRRTPLHYLYPLFPKNETQVVEFLVSHGADVNAVDEYGETPLHKCDHADTASLLIAHGADVDARDHQGETPLYGAYEAKARVLIDHRAEVNVYNDNGESPLHRCCSDGYDLEAARVLVASGAEVDARTREGETPLCAVWDDEDGELTSFLIASGADVNAPSTNGRTPLLWAALCGHVPRVKVLLSHGASIDAATTDALARAMERPDKEGKQEIINLLRAQQGQVQSKDEHAGRVQSEGGSSGKASRATGVGPSLIGSQRTGVTGFGEGPGTSEQLSTRASSASLGDSDTFDKTRPTPEQFGLTKSELDAFKEWDSQLRKRVVRALWISFPATIVLGLMTEKSHALFSFLLAICLLVGIVFFGSDPDALDRILRVARKRKSAWKSVEAYENALRQYEERVRQYEYARKRRTVEFWRSLDGVSFERELASLFRKLGYETRLTSHSGDLGVDIVLKKDGVTTIVQCKAHKNPVGPSVARDLHGSLLHHAADAAILASLSGFTPGVAEYVRGKPITLLGLDEIINLQLELHGDSKS